NNYGKKVGEINEFPEETKFSSGCMTMFKREPLFKIGLLNENYFFGCEEYDYSVKLLKKGYKMKFSKEAKLYHKVKINEGNGSSHDIKKPMYIFNSLRNKQIFAKENYSKIEYFLWKRIFSLYMNCLFINRFKNEDNLNVLNIIKDKVNKSYDVKNVLLEDLEEIDSVS
ncbi:glycosyltransferase family 2 protein, partial [Clostridium perfringens]